MLLVDVLLLIVSIIAIGKGSDWFTDSLIPLARRFGTSQVSIGLILVSVAVSFPEVLVAVYGVLKGHTAFSFGVTVGSVVCNIALMVGACALVHPLKVSNRIILRDGTFSIIVPILVFAVASGGQITRIEGFAFFLLFIPYLINVFMQEREGREKQKELESIELELDLLGFSFVKIRSVWMAFSLGLILLLVGAQLFTQSLLSVCSQLGFNEGIIGFSVGAIGPSIPNIVAAYQAARKGMTDIAVSSTLGSNVFTLLVTLGILAFLSPLEILDKNLFLDIAAVVVMSFLLFIFMITKKVISKKEGIVLILFYVLFLILQVLLS